MFLAERIDIAVTRIVDNWDRTRGDARTNPRIRYGNKGAISIAHARWFGAWSARLGLIGVVSTSTFRTMTPIWLLGVAVLVTAIVCLGIDIFYITMTVRYSREHNRSVDSIETMNRDGFSGD